MKGSWRDGNAVEMVASGMQRYLTSFGVSGELVVAVGAEMEWPKTPSWARAGLWEAYCADAELNGTCGRSWKFK
jgi:hypothetical protein